jgi:hypothetical protein
MRIEVGRLLVMKAAWEIDRGGFAQTEVSMAKIHVANLLHDAADTAIQINGARGYSKDTVLEWDPRDRAHTSQGGRLPLLPVVVPQPLNRFPVLVCELELDVGGQPLGDLLAPLVELGHEALVIDVHLVAGNHCKAHHGASSR